MNSENSAFVEIAMAVCIVAIVVLICFANWPIATSIVLGLAVLGWLLEFLVNHIPAPMTPQQKYRSRSNLLVTLMAKRSGYDDRLKQARTRVAHLESLQGRSEISGAVRDSVEAQLKEGRGNVALLELELSATTTDIDAARVKYDQSRGQMEELRVQRIFSDLARQHTRVQGA